MSPRPTLSFERPTAVSPHDAATNCRPMVPAPVTVFVPLLRLGFIYSPSLRLSPRWLRPHAASPRDHSHTGPGWSRRFGRAAEHVTPRPGLCEQHWAGGAPNASHGIAVACQLAEIVTCTEAPWQAFWFSGRFSIASVMPFSGGSNAFPLTGLSEPPTTK